MLRSPKWLILSSLLVASPDTPGVIELWDGEDLVYLGAARESIRQQLVHDLLEEDAWSGRTTHFGWEISFRPSARMREVLSEYETLHHRPPPFNA